MGHHGMRWIQGNRLVAMTAWLAAGAISTCLAQEANGPAEMPHIYVDYTKLLRKELNLPEQPAVLPTRTPKLQT